MPKDGYSGKIPVDRRIRNGLVTHIPVYNPELGDDLALYIRVLLERLLLSRIIRVSSGKAGEYVLPKNATAMGFHRNYSKELAESQGERSSVRRWRSVFSAFLLERSHTAKAKTNSNGMVSRCRKMKPSMLSTTLHFISQCSA